MSDDDRPTSIFDFKRRRRDRKRRRFMNALKVLIEEYAEIGEYMKDATVTWNGNQYKLVMHFHGKQPEPANDAEHSTIH